LLSRDASGRKPGRRSVPYLCRDAGASATPGLSGWWCLSRPGSRGDRDGSDPDTSHQPPPISIDNTDGELAGERDIYGSVLAAHPDIRGAANYQTAGAQPIDKTACPTTALSTAPGPGHDQKFRATP